MSVVTLDSLLRSRDVRWQTEQRLMREYKGKTLVVLTVVMPGSVKRDWRSLTVAHAAVEAINEELKNKYNEKFKNKHNEENRIIFSDTRDLETGFEGYWIVDEDALELKRELCNIEETHPLGRLFDIDVFNGSGMKDNDIVEAVPIPRTVIGFPPRRCLLCEHEARWCMRNHSHTQEEIQQKITDLVTSYNDHKA